MPAPKPVAGVVKVDFFKTNGHQSWSESFYVANVAGAAWTLADLQTLIDDCDADWAAHAAPIFPASVSLTHVMGTDLTSPTAFRYINTGAHAGTAETGVQTAVSNCVRTTFVGSGRYRGGRPGAFVSGYQAGDLVDPAHWTTAIVTQANDFWTQLRSNVNGLSLTGGVHPLMVIVHRFLAHAELLFPTVEPVVALETQQRVCSQRRRLGRGVAGE